MCPERTGTHAGALTQCLRNIEAYPTSASSALLARRDDDARREAHARDAMARLSGHDAPLAGVVLGVKACFDVRGWVTHAGSQVLADAPAASEDAALVRALRQAGAVLLAQNNMTEFAYGALGLNPWFGTPVSPLPSDVPRVAGGSSSGGAVAVALGMVSLALGSDTSGSVRIPAAFCGVAGFKPSRGRYDDAGMMHLSPSFDVPGVIAADVAQCLRVDQALAPWDRSAPTAGTSLARTSFVIPDHLDDELEPGVRHVFATWMERLGAAGAVLRRAPMPSLPLAGKVAREGGIIAAEAYALHAGRLAAKASAYDPRVGPRMLLGAQVPAHAYALAQQRLLALGRQYEDELGGADAVLTPTVPMLPPSLAELRDDSTYLSKNARAFSLTEFANRLDLPSISLPGDLNARQAVGLLVTGRTRRDRGLLQMARAIECVLRPGTQPMSRH